MDEKFFNINGNLFQKISNFDGKLFILIKVMKDHF
jgi:hypothetical protein